MNVVVTSLAGPVRHQLFDDAKSGSFDEVPAIAVGCVWASPFVVFGGLFADDLGWQLRRSLFFQD